MLTLYGRGGAVIYSALFPANAASFRCDYPEGRELQRVYAVAVEWLEL